MNAGHFLKWTLIGSFTLILVACGLNSNTLSVNFINSSKNNITDNTTKQDPLFKEFINSFPKKKLPLKITAETLNEFQLPANKSDKGNQKLIIDDKYGDLLPGLIDYKFSRMPMEGRNHYLAKIAETPKFIAVAYVSATKYNSFEGYNDRHASCQIATFTKDGELIDEEYIAYIGSSDGYTTAEITKDLNIIQKKFKYQYAKDINEFGYKNNPIISSDKYSEVIFTFNDSGEINESTKEVKKETQSKNKESKASSL